MLNFIAGMAMIRNQSINYQIYKLLFAVSAKLCLSEFVDVCKMQKLGRAIPSNKLERDLMSKKIPGVGDGGCGSKWQVFYNTCLQGKIQGGWESHILQYVLLRENQILWCVLQGQVQSN